MYLRANDIDFFFNFLSWVFETRIRAVIFISFILVIVALYYINESNDIADLWKDRVIFVGVIILLLLLYKLFNEVKLEYTKNS